MILPSLRRRGVELEVEMLREEQAKSEDDPPPLFKNQIFERGGGG